MGFLDTSLCTLRLGGGGRGLGEGFEGLVSSATRGVGVSYPTLYYYVYLFVCI